MAMNEKSIDTRVDTFLVILLPLAFVIVFLFATWPVLLGLLLFSLGYKLWRRYQWQQWSQQVNPIFHQLIRVNQGRITPMDLAMKANFSAAVAKRYLDCKAEEFGAQQQKYEDLGSVYYFITSSTLGSMLDESEPPSEEQQDEEIQNVKQVAAAGIEDRTKDDSSAVQVLVPETQVSSAVQVLAPETETSEEDSAISSASSIVPEASETTLEQVEPPSHTNSVPQSLIQSELAKRLNVYSSTVYKRRNDPEFSEWSRSRDPDGIAWKFSPKTKEFQPVKE